MTTNGAFVLETDRLVLRPYRHQDVDVLHALFVTPGVRRHLFDDQVMPREWVTVEIEDSLRSFRDRGCGQFTFRRRDDDRPIGFGGYRDFHQPPELQLLYAIAEKFWNRGYASEAAAALICWGFEELGFERIVASADAPNAASLRVMEKCGMHFDKRVALHGPHDTVYYALERRDWKPPEPPPYRLRALRG